MADVDRSRGVLTPADRRFLCGDVTLGSEQSRYDARYRIRQRTRDAILDCPLLFEHLADRDREQVFDAETAGLTEALVDAFAFLYLGASSLDADPQRLVAAGIGRAERRMRGAESQVLDVDVSVTASGAERIDRVAAQVDEGAVHDLDERDLRALARSLADCDDQAVADLIAESSK